MDTKIKLDLDAVHIRGHIRDGELWADRLCVKGVPFELGYMGSKLNRGAVTQLLCLNGKTKTELEELSRKAELSGPCDIEEII